VTTRDADATRGEHYRAALRSPTAVWLLAGAGSVALVAGAATGRPLVALVAPVVVLALILVLYWRAADRRAARDFYSAVADDLGFQYLGTVPLVRLTPLLGAGDRRVSEHVMVGPLTPEHEATLALYRYDVRRTDGDDGVESWDRHPFTVCVVDLGDRATAFRGLYLRARRHPVDRIGRHDWLAGRDLRSVDLESTAFGRVYELLVHENQDDAAVRRMFSPSLILRLAEHPLTPHLEYRGGALVVYVPGHVEDDGRLVWLLDTTRDLAARIDRELVEPRVSAPAR